ncbi:MAG: choline-sulfatase [Rhodospirillaceae bacterium]|nr:choline-sulfatase [Rhodospirillaceae bacterium]MBT6884940.1 choline-sulfatase [Rhodospirillaceae bacterium]MBT7248070.1 choline-sulfatase [Rhodospirillaceae bacterium]
MAASGTSRPNILVIQVDQMTPGVLPTYGHPLVKTPNIDKLAESGVVFESAYTNFPLCVPSRASMMSGQFAHNVQSWDNATEMPASIPTLAHYLRSADYHTVLCGKMHFIGPDQVHGFNERITTDIYPANFAWTPDWVRGERFRPTGINPQAIVEAGQCVRSLQMDYDDEVENIGVQKIYDLARFNTDKPFLMWMSFTHPHSPFVTKKKYWDLYDHDAIDMPKVPPIPVEDLDAMSRWLYYAHGHDLLDIEDEHVRNARHAYYGMTSYLDDKVRRIMDALAEVDLDDNTVVVLTSDHGEMLGERGSWFKQYFYENSVRVPMIISHPGTYAPGRVSEHVSLVDLLPTFMDIATDGNAPDPVSPLDGNSLTGLLSGSDENWDNTVISEYTGEGVIAPCRMIRRGNYKYIYTHGHPALMYDTNNDPLELENLIGNPDHADMEAELGRDILVDWAPDVINDLCIQSQKDRMFIQASTGGDPHWAFISRPDDGGRFVRNAGATQTKSKARYPFVEPAPLRG